MLTKPCIYPMVNSVSMAKHCRAERLGEQLPGSGGAQASSFHVKRHQNFITPYDTNRLWGTLGGRGGRTENRRKKNMTPPHGTSRGLGFRSSVEGWGGGGGWGLWRIQREERTPGRENPGDYRDLGTGQVRKRVVTRRPKVGTARAKNSFGPTGMGGKRIWVVAAGRQERYLGGRSLRNHAIEERERSGRKEREKRRRQVKEGGDRG